MFRVLLPLSSMLCVSSVVSAASPELTDVLDALQVRAQQVQAGLFSFIETEEMQLREPPSERALRKRAKKKEEALRKRDTAAGRERPEHIYTQFAEREFSIMREVNRRHAENPVSRYRETIYIDPPFARVQTVEIVDDEEQEKRTSDFVERTKRSDPWASEQDLRSKASRGAATPTTQVLDEENVIQFTPSGSGAAVALVRALPDGLTGARFCRFHPARFEQPHNVENLRSLRVQFETSRSEELEHCVRLDTFRDDVLVSQRWVSPKYGYALVRIVPYSRNGQPMAVTSYSQFKKLSNGVWWAMRRDRRVGQRQETRQYTSVKLGRMPRLRKVTFPKGTRVHDTRVEPQVMYVIDARRPGILPMSELEKLAAKKRARSTSRKQPRRRK